MPVDFGEEYVAKLETHVWLGLIHASLNVCSHRTKIRCRDEIAQKLKPQHARAGPIDSHARGLRLTPVVVRLQHVPIGAGVVSRSQQTPYVRDVPTLHPSLLLICCARSELRWVRLPPDARYVGVRWRLDQERGVDVP